VLKKTLGIPLFQEQVIKLAMVAADYTPGEADQLRRDMAAWRKSGRIERHRERLVARMMKKGIAREFAERVFEQIRGFGEYGFPESHAASFALIAYGTAWLKRHYPAAFLCALLNAQPMGFYSASTLVEDAKRHGLSVRPVDVLHSAWDCTLEPCPGSGEGHAVRMGLRYVKGLRQTDAQRMLAARHRGAFRSVDDLAARASLESPVLARLAESGALHGLQGERRSALWEALGADTLSDALPLEHRDAAVEFTPLDAFEEINWDYAFTEHSTLGHPLTPLREALAAQGLPEAASIRHLRNGSRVRYAGLVICRQRPGTAKGVLFMTLEDETGLVNLVVWQKILEKYELLAKTQSFLGVTGKLQIESGVVHLVAEELWQPELDRRPRKAKSRDFH
jgi:error-prone DNA polymerase